MTIAPLTQLHAPTADAARHRKLVDAAQQFEAMFLQQLLKSSAPDGESQTSDGLCGQDDAGPAETYRGFGNEAVAKAIAASGGMGIARQIVLQVERTTHPHTMSEEIIGTSLKSPAEAPMKEVGGGYAQHP